MKHHSSPAHEDAHVEALDQLHCIRRRRQRGQNGLAATGQGGEQLGLQSTWEKGDVGETYGSPPQKNGLGCLQELFVYGYLWFIGCVLKSFGVKNGD